MSILKSSTELPDTDTATSRRSEKGYPWLFFHAGRTWGTGLIVTLLVTAISGTFYLWYTQAGNDTSPDSEAGLAYAVIGTLFLILAAVLYSLRRRSRKRVVGQLNAALNWHVFFAVMGLVVLFMHSFGHFAAISGTYALFGMVTLTLSGVVGRMLDHFLPRLIAGEVDKVLTSQGDDGIEVVSQKLQAIVVHNTQQIRGFKLDDAHLVDVPTAPHHPTDDSLPFATNGQSLSTPWDLAYISLETTQQELDRAAPRHRFIPDKKSAFTRPGAMMPGAEEQISELQDMQRAMQREQFCRYLIRYWRVLHIFLVFITIGLVTWHIIFALQLMLPRFFHF
jgi:fumarate reductase subunit D